MVSPEREDALRIALALTAGLEDRARTRMERLGGEQPLGEISIRRPDPLVKFDAIDHRARVVCDCCGRAFPRGTLKPAWGCLTCGGPD